jgi:hypothetical protein
MSCYAYLDDQSGFDATVTDYQNNGFTDYNDANSSQPGTFQEELDRSESFDYTFHRIMPHMYCCEIAQYMGHEDLYEYQASEDSAAGSTMRDVVDEMIPFVEDSDLSSWTYGTIKDTHDSEWNNKVPSVYELAYSRWQDTAYNDVFSLSHIASRPIDGSRCWGYVTLTHGKRMEM